jgi:HPt (histidine-containing phosphotransfer) domain-containing protein
MVTNNKTENFLEFFQSECVKNETLDERIFLDLNSEVGANILSEIIISYSKTLDESFVALRATLETADTEKSYRICHKLKGSSMLIGFSHLAQSCGQVCSDFKSQRDNNWYNSLKLIMDEVAKIKKVIIVAQTPYQKGLAD